MVVGGYFFFMSVCIGYVVYISESRHIHIQEYIIYIEFVIVYYSLLFVVLISKIKWII